MITVRRTTTLAMKMIAINQVLETLASSSTHITIVTVEREQISGMPYSKTPQTALEQRRERAHTPNPVSPGAALSPAEAHNDS